MAKNFKKLKSDVFLRKLQDTLKEFDVSLKATGTKLDGTLIELDESKIDLNNKNKLHIATLGRLCKYENTVNEALEFAKKNRFTIKVNSSVIGVFTKVKPCGRIYIHYTHEDKIIKGKRGKAASPEERGKSYDGVFVYADFKEAFDKLLKKVESFDKLEDLFNL